MSDEIDGRDGLVQREEARRHQQHRQASEDVVWARETFRSEALDRGIIRIVRVLTDGGIETWQSCEGGHGHSYEWPSVDIIDRPWAALDLCVMYDLPVHTISNLFEIWEGKPTRPFWRVEFSPHKMKHRYETWYGDAEEMVGIGWTRDRQQLAEDARELTEKQRIAAVSRTVAMVIQMRCDTPCIGIYHDEEMHNSGDASWTLLRFHGADDIAVRATDGAAFYVNREGEPAHDAFLRWAEGGRAIFFDEPT